MAVLSAIFDLAALLIVLHEISNLEAIVIGFAGLNRCFNLHTKQVGGWKTYIVQNNKCFLYSIDQACSMLYYVKEENFFPDSLRAKYKSVPSQRI